MTEQQQQQPLENARKTLDANIDVAYQAALADLDAQMKKPEATYDTVFKLCRGADKSTLNYCGDKLRADGFDVEVKSEDGPTDWSSPYSFLAVKVPQTTSRK